MNQEHKDVLEKVRQLIKDIPNEDKNVEKLEEAMQYWCGNYDICDGFKYAINQCLDDQYNNHENEQELADLLTLRAILER